MKSKLSIGNVFVVLTSLLCCCMFLNGCLESSFQLADQSRMPAWIHIPSGLTRSDVSLTMNYYSTSGPDVTFVLRDKHGTVLQKVRGYQKRFEQYTPATHPFYQVVIVNGLKEVIEHKKMEPIFYVSDDPVLKNTPVLKTAPVQ